MSDLTHKACADLSRRLREFYGPVGEVMTGDVAIHHEAADTIDALISAMHEALPTLELASVGTRGRYGSKKAEAYRVALKTAFVQAIGRRQAERAA